MNAYAASSSAVAMCVLALVGCIPVVGLLVTRLPHPATARIAAWALAVGTVATAHVLADGEAPGFRLLALCGCGIYGMKAVVAVEDRLARGIQLSPLRYLAWTVMWPGMIPASFRTVPGPARTGAGALIVRGLVWLACGAIAVALARATWRASGSALLASPMLLVGLSLILHFGLFNLMAGAWRGVGASVDTCFPAPLVSTSLSEFWSRRWNLPFTEMVQRAVYRPLAGTLGSGVAAMCGFLFSGALHEMAISLPVRVGYGLPTLYFLLHGALVLVERRWFARGAALARRPWLGRTWTILWLALPAPILFHPPFLAGVAWPFLGAR